MARPKSRKLTLKTFTRCLVVSLVLTPVIWLFYIEAGRTVSYIAIRQIAKTTAPKHQTRRYSGTGRATASFLKMISILVQP